MRMTISGGVEAGASKPNQGATAKPARPDSAIVGTFGSAAERLLLVTASPRTRPDWMWLTSEGMLLKTESTLPPIRSVIAGAAPLYGTWISCTPAPLPNIAPSR